MKTRRLAWGWISLLLSSGCSGEAVPSVEGEGNIAAPPLTVAVLYRKPPDSAPEALLDGTVVEQGEHLMPCAAGRAGWVSLIGRDGSGISTHYGRWPVTETLTCAPFAIALDDAPGPERFWLLHTTREDDPIRVTPTLDAVGWVFPKSRGGAPQTFEPAPEKP